MNLSFFSNFYFYCVPSQVILLEMAKFEVFTKSSGMRTHLPKALIVSVLGPQNDHNTNAAKSLRSFAKQLEISGVKVNKNKNAKTFVHKSGLLLRLEKGMWGTGGEGCRSVRTLASHQCVCSERIFFPSDCGVPLTNGT